ncbi:MAG: hypothetical protein K6T75_04510 [Acetobacteraceae bacterium]|nr:hypothetical protein [Acetobacteraceae bacterium]
MYLARREWLLAVEGEALASGRGGVATLACAGGDHKPASFYRRFGYAGWRGGRSLLYRPLAPEARPPRCLEPGASALGTASGVFVDGRQVDRGPCRPGQAFALLDDACGMGAPGPGCGPLP